MFSRTALLPLGIDWGRKQTLLLSPGSHASPPTLYGRFFLWYRRRRTYYLLFCRMMLTKPKPRTALCLVCSEELHQPTRLCVSHSIALTTRMSVMNSKRCPWTGLNVIFYRSRKELLDGALDGMHHHPKMKF